MSSPSKVTFQLKVHLNSKMPVDGHALAVAALGVSGVGGDPAVAGALPPEGKSRHLVASVLIPVLARPS